MFLCSQRNVPGFCMQKKKQVKVCKRNVSDCSVKLTSSFPYKTAPTVFRSTIKLLN